MQSASVQTTRPPRWQRGHGGGRFGTYEERKQYYFEAAVRAEASKRSLEVAWHGWHAWQGWQNWSESAAPPGRPAVSSGWGDDGQGKGDDGKDKGDDDKTWSSWT